MYLLKNIFNSETKNYRNFVAKKKNCLKAIIKLHYQSYRNHAIAHTVQMHRYVMFSTNNFRKHAYVNPQRVGKLEKMTNRG